MSESETNETIRIKEYKNRDKGEEVRERDSYRQSLSAQEQIKALDLRLGIGLGAVKERTRLNVIERE